MAFTQGVPSFSFDRQAAYRIRVEGRLDPSWCDRLAGMTLCPETSGDGLPTTTLLGKLADQAALAGVLRTLYELHRPLMLVERLSPGEHAAERAA